MVERVLSMINILLRIDCIVCVCSEHIYITQMEEELGIKWFCYKMLRRSGTENEQLKLICQLIIEEK